MALGGGTFVSQNKKLGGTYHNFVSARRDFLTLAQRGFVALPLVMSWGADGEVMTITSEDFQRNSLGLLGYSYDSEEMKPLREVFRKSHTIFLYPIKGADAVLAANTFGKAKYKGTRGNDIKLVVQANVDEPAKFDVKTFLGTEMVDEQIAVASSATLVDNEWVEFIKTSTLAVNAGLNMTGGTDGTVAVATYQAALDEFEAYAFNVLIADTVLAGVKPLFVAYTTRMRNDVGAKFQLVGRDLGTPDQEGIINTFNEATEGADKLSYWIGGASAGVAVNASNENALYNGEYTVDFTGAKTQNQLIALQEQGRYVLHKVNAQAHVLADINSFTSFTTDKNEDFALNQVIRVIDQIAIDTANIFNGQFLGKVPNDKDGRVSLWGALVANRNELNRIRAIQNYDSSKMVIGPGIQKNAVVAEEEIETAVAMSKLYITTVVA